MGKHEAIGMSDEWYTPKKVFDALNCRFDLDVAHPTQETFVPCDRFITEGSLESEWNGFIWMNPPFGGRNGMVPWNEKFIAHGNGIAFCVDRTSADWWQDFEEQTDAVLFVRGKLKMYKPDGTTGNQPGNGTTLSAIGAKGIEALRRAEKNGLGKFYLNQTMSYENYLDGICKVHFTKYSIEKYGYSDLYYLGFPTIMDFFNETIDFDFPKVLALGELRERKLIEIHRKAIIKANKLYNETFTQ